MAAGALEGDERAPARVVRGEALAGDQALAIERPVPAIVSPALQARAVAVLAETKRYAGGKARRPPGAIFARPGIRPRPARAARNPP